MHQLFISLPLSAGYVFKAVLLSLRSVARIDEATFLLLVEPTLILSCVLEKVLLDLQDLLILRDSVGLWLEARVIHPSEFRVPGVCLSIHC